MVTKIITHTCLFRTGKELGEWVEKNVNVSKTTKLIIDVNKHEIKIEEVDV